MVGIKQIKHLLGYVRGLSNLKNMEGTYGGMPILEFFQLMLENPNKAVNLLSDSELKDFKQDAQFKMLSKLRRDIKKAVNSEIEKRDL